MTSTQPTLSNGYNVNLAGHSFLLLPQRALFWSEYQILIIADLHLGKVSHFRKSGVALPVDAILHQMARLKDLIGSIKPRKTIFLGDLFHSEANAEWKFFQRDILSLPLQEFILVKGNHDIIPVDQYKKAGVQICDAFSLSGIKLVHEATEDSSEFVICGHIHPGYLLKGRGRQTARLPCLYKTRNKAVVPAYGDLTGLCIIQPSPGDEIYLVSNHKILPLHF